MDAVEAEVVRTAKSRLESAGFELLSFRLTDCSVTQQSFD